MQLYDMPVYHSLLSLVLERLPQKESCKGKELCRSIADDLPLTKEQRVGLVDKPKRGIYQANAVGIDFFKKHGFNLDLKLVISQPKFKEYYENKKNQDEEKLSKDTAVITQESFADSPLKEIMENAFVQISESFKEELLEAILERDKEGRPREFFEELTLKLMVKMGYGDGIVTQRSNDGGIDAIVSQDALGFSSQRPASQRPLTSSLKRAI